jgi:hypothetical protein
LTREIESPALDDPAPRRDWAFRAARTSMLGGGRSLMRRSPKASAALKSALAGRPDRTGRPRRLVNSVDGQIEHLLLMIPRGATKPVYADVYRALMKALPADTRFICVVQESTASAVRSWLAAAGRNGDDRVIVVPEYVGFTVWAQDPFCAARRESGWTLVEPVSFLRFGDMLVAGPVAANAGFTLEQVPVYFQGGNVLVGDDFWLLGGDYFYKTLEFLNKVIFPQGDPHPLAFVRSLFQTHLDDRRLLVVEARTPVPAETQLLVEEHGRLLIDHVHRGNIDGTVQPIFHLDMYVTLAGRDRRDGRYRILVGEPTVPRAKYAERYRAYALAPVFDELAASLQAAGGRRVKVLRNPLPLVSRSERVDVSAFDRPNDAQQYRFFVRLKAAGQATVVVRRWYFASSNNAIVQKTPAGDTVWLPTYGDDHYPELRRTDRLNRAIWRQMGYKTVMMPPMHHMAYRLGSLHCMQHAFRA